MKSWLIDEEQFTVYALYFVKFIIWFLFLEHSYVVKVYKHVSLEKGGKWEKPANSSKTQIKLKRLKYDTSN